VPELAPVMIAEDMSSWRQKVKYWCEYEHEYQSCNMLHLVSMVGISHVGWLSTSSTLTRVCSNDQAACQMRFEAEAGH